MEPQSNRLSRKGDEKQLEPLTMDVLAYLLQRSGKVVSAEELLSQVWGGRPIHRAAVKKRIGQIRSALGDSVDCPRYISTIPKRGYCLIAPVENVDTRRDVLTAFPNGQPDTWADELRSIGNDLKSDVQTFGTDLKEPDAAKRPASKAGNDSKTEIEAPKEG